MKKVLSIINAPQSHWVGDGFPVKTLFSYQRQGSLVSPFLLLDLAGPMKFSPTNKKRGVGAHPHRGFETVTIVYEGELAHKDSTGEQGLIGPGDVQWMTAGKGILHQEFHSDAFSQKGGQLDSIQLWVNLPKRDKMTAPRYQTITAKQIPIVELPDNQGCLRLISGHFNSLKGPANSYTPMLVMDAEINALGLCELPIEDGWSAIVIIRKGQVTVNNVELFATQSVILSQVGEGIELQAQQTSELLILAGEPIDEPLIGYGPFVMNTETEIEQAISDFNNGRFGSLELD